MHQGLRTCAFFMVCLVLLTGCSKIMGGLRKDLDDSVPADYSQPTVGGRWSEKGYLDEEVPGANGERYASLGHAERNTASDEYRGGSNPGSWMSGESAESASRDRYRGLASEGEEAMAPAPMGYSDTANLPPAVKRQYKNGSRATAADFSEPETNDGSLWASDGQTNYYFTKNKVRGVGDLVTITVEPELVRDTAVEVTRSLTPEERNVELAVAQGKIREKTLAAVAPAQGANRAPAAAPAPGAAGANAQAQPPAGLKRELTEEEEKMIPRATLADIDVTPSMEMKAGDTIMAEIVERYPNGNYKVRGTKRVRYRNGTRMVTVLAVAKGTDITEEDVIPSGKLYEYRLEARR